MKKRTKEGMEFSTLISRMRSKSDISVEIICEGLCKEQEIYYMEKGERDFSSLLQEAILERLGTGADDFEYYLDYEDYMRWKERHDILHTIIFEKFQETEVLLEKYKRTYCNFLDKYISHRQTKDLLPIKAEEKLEFQFYLSMLALLRKCQGRPKEELYELFEKALSLTVDEYDKRPVSDRALSFKELNLILETERHRKEGERCEKYIEILNYLEKKQIDSKGKVKIYPKAVYYLCSSIKNDNCLSSLLKYCNQALNVLQDTRRMYFLWEILSIREKLLYQWKQKLHDKNHVSMIESLLQKNKEWRMVLEKVYNEEQIPKETFEYCYLYISKGVCCINDVIRIRRKMLGLSQKNLSEGICDVKTVRRLEQYKTSPQRAITEELFIRLGLSRELTKTDLVTSSPEAKELWGKVRNYVHNRYWDKVDKTMTRIRELVPPEIKCNQQAFMKKEALLLKVSGRISVEEYHRKLKEALEMTLPYEAFLQEGEKYLTYGEQTCIQMRMIGMEKGSEELLTCMRRFEEIYSYYMDNDLVEAVMGTYDYFMGYVGEKWGKEGEYDKSDYYNKMIIKYCLRCRINSSLAYSLYDRWRNNRKRIEEGISVDKSLDAEEELTKCVLFSQLAKSNDECSYKEELDKIQEKKQW